MNKLLPVAIVLLFVVSTGLAQAQLEPRKTHSPDSGEHLPVPADIQSLLVKSTCTTCHEVKKRKVGPPFSAIAGKKYTPEEIINLIYNPKPEHWPDYVVPMPPMRQVSKENALKIAVWINSLSKDHGGPGSLP